MKNKNGYNLIELLVTLAIAGIITAIALPNLKWMYERRLNEQTLANLSEAIYKAKSIALRNEKAINDNVRSYIVIDGNIGCVLYSRNGIYTAKDTCSFSTDEEKNALLTWKFSLPSQWKINNSSIKTCFSFDKYALFINNSLNGIPCADKIDYEIGVDEKLSGSIL